MVREAKPRKERENKREGPSRQAEAMDLTLSSKALCGL